MALTPAETTFVATHEVPVVTAMKPYLNDAREAANLLAPTNTQPPVISGSGAVGGPLHATSGVWTGTPYPTLTYQWKADGVNIAGATSANYTPVAGDAGKTITCTVTATNSHGSISATSNGILLAVAADTTAPTATAFLPIDNATGVAAGTDLVVTISETVVLGTGVITLKKTSDNSTVKAWNVATDGGSVAGKVEVVGGTALTLHLTSAMANSTEHYVIWDANVVKDAANNPIAAQASTTLWSFTTVASSFTGLLDTYPTASMAYSFRKLRGAYAGSAVRIRRSSDNLELNIGFDGSGNFDTAAAAAHIGGGTGAIVTWFDQSGNGRDLAQATAASQPAYAATGMNSKPAADWDGTNDEMAIAGFSNTIFPTTLTIMAVMQEQIAGSRGFHNWNAADPAHFTQSATFGGSLYWDYGQTNTTGRVSITAPSGWNTGGHLLELGREAANNQFITVDGVERVRGTTTYTAIPLGGSLPFYVGSQGGTGYWDGPISELVWWAADLAANRSAARANITAYWLPAASTLLLDVLGVSATRAYSTRKLRAAYAGSAIRIRRSSDNAEQDIGFVGENLDTAAITTFVGANSAYVVTMYDQSGSAVNATQATAGLQPRIVNAGTLEVRNTKVAPLFDGTDDVLATAATAVTCYTAGGVAAINSASPFSDYMGVLSSVSSTWVFIGAAAATTYSNASSSLGAVDVNNSGANTAIFGGVLQNLRVTSASALSTSEVLVVGQDRVGGREWQGWIGEVVMFAAQLSAPNYATLYTNQQAYWQTGLLLDTLGVTATRAYSTRKLRYAYAGSAIRIRRSSDNAEQDIGFVGENLDTASIATFVGANSAYVVTWYDQSGNAVNATQATVAQQARIVNAGTLDVKNTKPVALFDGSNDRYDTASSTYNVQMVGAVAATSLAGPNWTDYQTIIATVATTDLLEGNSLGSPSFFVTGNFNTVSVNNTGSPNAVFGGTLMQVNGYKSSAALSVTDGLQLGCDRTIAGRMWPGWIGEVVVYSASLSAGNITAQYTNQKTYWGTP